MLLHESTSYRPGSGILRASSFHVKKEAFGINGDDYVEEVLIVNVSDFPYDNDGLALAWKIVEGIYSIEFFRVEDSTLSTLSTATQKLIHESTSYRTNSCKLNHSCFI